MITMRTVSHGTDLSSDLSVADREPETPDTNRDVDGDRICIKCKGRIVFLDLDEIEWIEAAGNYLRLHTRSETYVVRDTLAQFAHRLESQRFLRIHRSIIVNARYIRELKPWHTGEYVLTLTNGKELTLSRKYRSSLLQFAALERCIKRTRQARPLSEAARRRRCQKCSLRLRRSAAAYACEQECTFCQPCAAALNHVCPNCGGKLLDRRLK
jgi:LytTr DNA-binding domain/Protein of unknown function (DUF1272)